MGTNSSGGGLMENLRQIVILSNVGYHYPIGINLSFVLDMST